MRVARVGSVVVSAPLNTIGPPGGQTVPVVVTCTVPVRVTVEVPAVPVRVVVAVPAVAVVTVPGVQGGCVYISIVPAVVA
jgi:hypothetical protein